jgi:hypothetical protein
VPVERRFSHRTQDVPAASRLPLFHLIKGLTMTRLTTSRRIFMMTVATATTGLALSRTAAAQGAKVDEKDAQAVALGYVHDATKTDKKKYAKYAAGQVCGNCALYQGKAGDAAGGCPLFAGKQVDAKGWCSAYAKKA